MTSSFLTLCSQCKCGEVIIQFCLTIWYIISIEHALRRYGTEKNQQGRSNPQRAAMSCQHLLLIHHMCLCACIQRIIEMQFFFPIIPSKFKQQFHLLDGYVYQTHCGCPQLLHFFPRRQISKVLPPMQKVKYKNVLVKAISNSSSRRLTDDGSA